MEKSETDRRHAVFQVCTLSVGRGSLPDGRPARVLRNGESKPMMNDLAPEKKKNEPEP